MVLLPFEITKCLQPFRVRLFTPAIPRRFNQDTFLLCALMWLMYAWKCILERKTPEALSIIQYMLRLLVLAPEYNLIMVQVIML